MNKYILKLLVMCLIIVLLGCSNEKKQISVIEYKFNDIHWVEGVKPKLSEEQMNIAKLFLDSVYSGDFLKYNLLFADSSVSYRKTHFWKDVQKNKVDSQSYWYGYKDDSEFSFIYNSGSGQYDVFCFKKINNIWKIVSSDATVAE